MARRRFSDGLIDNAVVVFQRRTNRQLTRAEAIQMLEEMTGFFMMLHQADVSDRRRHAGADAKREG